jgi:hypothetical protein
MAGFHFRRQTTMTRTTLTPGMALLVLLPYAAQAEPALPQPSVAPPFQTLDLNLDESQEVTIAGRKVALKLVYLKEKVIRCEERFAGRKCVSKLRDGR